MRFVGQAEVAAFLRSQPIETGRLQSWVAEIRSGNWKNAEDLSSDFQDIDSSQAPLTVFRFGKPPIQIETLVDFRTNVLVLLAIRTPQLYFAPLQYRNGRRDN